MCQGKLSICKETINSIHGLSSTLDRKKGKIRETWRFHLLILKIAKLFWHLLCAKPRYTLHSRQLPTQTSLLIAIVIYHGPIFKKVKCYQVLMKSHLAAYMGGWEHTQKNSHSILYTLMCYTNIFSMCKNVFLSLFVCILGCWLLQIAWLSVMQIKRHL